MTEPGTRELDRAPDPGTVVPCPLKQGAHIAVGRCVEWQQSNGCGCEYALVSLRATERHLGEPVRHCRTDGDHFGASAKAEVEERAEQLDAVRGLIARAEQIEKARAVVAPAPPPPARPPPPAMPGYARAPPPPPKEPIMSNHKSAALAASDDEVRRAYAASGGSINKTMEKLGTTSWATVKKRCEALGLLGGAKALPVPKPNEPRSVPAPPTPPSLAAVAEKHAHAAPGDIVDLLKQRLAHHQEQAGKIEKALAALR